VKKNSNRENGLERESRGAVAEGGDGPPQQLGDLMFRVGGDSLIQSTSDDGLVVLPI